MNPLPSPALLHALIELVHPRSELEPITCAHLTAMFIAPDGAFVTRARISHQIYVCVGRKPFTGQDDVWSEWPAWQLRWATGPLDAAFGLVERMLPGVNFLYHRLAEMELPYSCRLLLGTDTVLGKGEHEDGPSAVVLALLNALLAQHQNADAAGRGE